MSAIVPYRRRAPRRPILLRKLRRKPIRKAIMHRKQGKLAIAKGLRQSIIPFKRTMSQIIDTNQTSNLPHNWAVSSGDVTGYHALLGTQIFQLSQLPEFNNIQNMYKWYKINCVVIKLYPCYTSNVPNGATSISSSQSYQGQNLICTYTKNQSGTGLSSTIDNDYWLTQQARKTRIITGNRPITFKVFPKLLNEVYSSITNTDYTLMRPKFISTNEPSTPFFGLDMAFTLTDYNDPFQVDLAANYRTPIKFRMDCTYYLSLKGTH